MQAMALGDVGPGSDCGGCWNTVYHLPSSSFHSLLVDPLSPLSQKGFAGAAALEVACVNGERRQGSSLQATEPLPSFPSGRPVGRNPRVL